MQAGSAVWRRWHHALCPSALFTGLHESGRLAGFPQVPSDWGKQQAQGLKKNHSSTPGWWEQPVSIPSKLTHYTSQVDLSHTHTLLWLKRTDSHTGKYRNWGEMSYFLENTCLLAEWPRCTLGSSTSIFHGNCFLKSPLHQTLARAWQPLSSVYLTGTLQLTCVFPPKLNEILPLNLQDLGSSLGSQGR